MEKQVASDKRSIEDLQRRLRIAQEQRPEECAALNNAQTYSATANTDNVASASRIMSWNSRIHDESSSDLSEDVQTSVRSASRRSASRKRSQRFAASIDESPDRIELAAAKTVANTLMQEFAASAANGSGAMTEVACARAGLRVVRSCTAFVERSAGGSLKGVSMDMLPFHVLGSTEYLKDAVDEVQSHVNSIAMSKELKNEIKQLQVSGVYCAIYNIYM